jgi:NAD(P)-dependent dehydrogenase (short-subunit alcohol dehydrogenase family)
MAKKTASSAGVALITGGASGIGLAIATRLLKHTWSVAVVDLDQRAVGAAEASLARAGTLFAVLDVTDEAAVRAMVDRVEAQLGPLTGLVNSAGIAADRHVFDTPVALLRRILEVNVAGTFIVGQAVAERMRERKAGSIVNLASVAGVRGSKGRSAYGGSKGAVITMTQSMATDLARYGIRVNAIAPGPIETPMVKTMHDPATRAVWMRHVPMRRYGTPEEVASAAHFLLDDGWSSYITGEILAVDGGFRGAGIIADD